MLFVVYGNKLFLEGFMIFTPLYANCVLFPVLHKAFQTCPRVQWRLCPTQSLQFCGTGQVFGVQSSLTQHRSQLGSNLFGSCHYVTIFYIFLRMKGGERFRTSDLIQTGNLIFVSIPVFSL